MTCTVVCISIPRHLQNDGADERGWDAGDEGNSSAGSGDEGPARGNRYDPFAEEEVHGCGQNRVCCASAGTPEQSSACRDTAGPILRDIHDG